MNIMLVSVAERRDWHRKALEASPNVIVANSLWRRWLTLLQGSWASPWARY